MIKQSLYQADFFKSWESIEPGSIDLILTDFPYGCIKDVQSWDTKPDIEKLEEIYNTLLKHTGQILTFCNLDLLIDLMAGFTNNFKFKEYYIWQKTSPMPISKFRALPDTEFILRFCRKGILEKDLTWNWRELGESGQPYQKRNYDCNDFLKTRAGKKNTEVNHNLDGWRYPRQILKYPNKPNFNKNERLSHPTQKPLALLQKLVKTFSNKGDIILDNFAGSGTTLAAAFKENRKSIGFEIQTEYYQEAKQRLDNLTAQEVLF